LQRFDHYLGDPGYLPKWIAAIDAVTPADVSRVVRQYMGKNARVTVVTRPSASSAADATLPSARGARQGAAVMRSPRACSGSSSRLRRLRRKRQDIPCQSADAAELQRSSAPDPEAWRGERPKPGLPGELNFPVPDVLKLSNGLSVYLVKRPAAVVTLELVVRHGAFLGSGRQERSRLAHGAHARRKHAASHEP
jgi:zinc protease